MDDRVTAPPGTRGFENSETAQARLGAQTWTLSRSPMLQGLARHRDALLPVTQRVRFEAGGGLQADVEAPIHFIEDGLVLEIAQAGNRQAAIRCIGREGIFSPDLLHGSAAGASAYCLTEVRAAVIDRATIARICDADPAARALFEAFARAAFSEVSQNLVAITHLKFEQRLARWLSVCFDRSGLAALQLTHDSLARLLGVRRASVTVGLHVLEGEHAIKATRGCIQLRDGERLRALAS
jgi:CRP-like cAMP-binding protein